MDWLTQNGIHLLPLPVMTEGAERLTPYGVHSLYRAKVAA
jgi:hypothetical protein